MLKPVGEKMYDYWVYICPLDAEFSNRSAVARLRSASTVAAPWSSIEIDERPLIDQLLDSAEHSPVPTSIGTMIDMIRAINHREEMKYQAKVMKDSTYFQYLNGTAFEKD